MGEADVLKILSIPIFVIFTALFATRAVRAVVFRKKIAMPHNFTEGVFGGISYPLYILVYGLIFIMSAICLASAPISEPNYVIRVLFLTLLCLLFLFFRARIPPLISIWFGRTSFWYRSGIKGKIDYREIFGAKLLREPKSRNPHALCKLVFFAQGRNTGGVPRRFCCKLPLSDLDVLASQIQITSPKGTPSDYRLSGRLKIVRSVTSILVCTVVLSVLVFIFTSGFASPIAYKCDQSQGYTSSEEVKTVSAISNVVYADGKIFVHYKKVEIVNVYNENGEFIASISLMRTAANSSKIEVVTTENNEKIFRYIIEETAYNFTLDPTFISTEQLEGQVFSEAITNRYIVAGEDSLIRFSDNKVELQREGGEFVKIIGGESLPIGRQFLWISVCLQIFTLCLLKHFNRRWSALIYSTNIYSEIIDESLT